MKHHYHEGSHCKKEAMLRTEASICYEKRLVRSFFSLSCCCAVHDSVSADEGTSAIDSSHLLTLHLTANGVSGRYSVRNVRQFKNLVQISNLAYNFLNRSMKLKLVFQKTLDSFLMRTP